MRTVRSALMGALEAALWPSYVGLAAYTARHAPWPRSLALLTGTTLGLLAAAGLVANLVRWAFGTDGVVEAFLGVPRDVCRQARKAGLVLVAAGVLFLIPCWILSRGMFAPGGRAIPAPTVVRGLTLAFELCVLAVVFRLTRRSSPLFLRLAEADGDLGWLGRRRRMVALASLFSVLAVIALDARGYCYSARRLASGLAGTFAVLLACWALRRLLIKAVDRHAWKWIRLGRSLAGAEPPGSSAMPVDLALRLKRLAGYGTVLVGLFLTALVWDLDLALFRFIAEQPLWSVDGDEEFVTAGELTRAVVILGLCCVAWRHISTFFAVAVFPRMPDDPGLRFAVVTLCRYAVLGLGLLVGLSSIHLGIQKVGVVLAALGVGLGFGLQEVISNFVCGIILLLERPIRVGDIVTVVGMSGKVDRINIRATTIVNGDNQSIIVPNRAFITGDLVNWTLRDKVVRVTVRVRVAHGSDCDRVSEILLAIAREHADVLNNPVPTALMEDFSDSGLMFVLHAHVPDPSISGRVRHRLFAEIQKRFVSEGIQIPIPTQQLLVKPAVGPASPAGPATREPIRAEPASRTPPPRHWPPRIQAADAREAGHRAVDE